MKETSGLSKQRTDGVWEDISTILTGWHPLCSVGSSVSQSLLLQSGLDSSAKKMYFHRKRIDKDKRGRWYAFYECSTSAARRYEKCTPHYIRKDKLEPDVLAAIQLQVQAALDYDKLLGKLRNSEGERCIRDKHNALISSLNLKLNSVAKNQNLFKVL